jgi:hypothetical protein
MSRSYVTLEVKSANWIPSARVGSRTSKAGCVRFYFTNEVAGDGLVGVLPEDLANIN